MPQSESDAGYQTAAVIARLTALALEMGGAADESAIIRAACSAPTRVLGAGEFTYVAAPAAHDPESVPVEGRHGVVGYLRYAGASAGADLRSLQQGVASLLGVSLHALHQRRYNGRLREALTTDRAYFEQLFASAPEGIVVLDGEDRIVRMNQEFERMFGYSSAEAEGRTTTELIVPSDLSGEARALTATVTRGQSIQTETIRQRRDGTTFPVSILATPIVVDGDQVAVYGIYRDITAQKDAEEALRRLSTTDDLTGLLNRRGFFALAEQQRRIAVRRQADLLLLYLDIDDFKDINDTWGHAVGDEVLASLGALLRDCYRESDLLARLSAGADVIARMGGDEFVLLAVDVEPNGEEVLLSRLRERLAQFNADQSRTRPVTISVGAIRVKPDSDTTLDSILAAADRLMYDKKRSLLKLR
jgi:diguanylate cyclase (GGDEF)-like protein/PAS domain S-box-containing protein